MRIVQINLFLLAAGLLASPSMSATAQDMQAPEVVEYELDNGLQVFLVPDNAAPTVAVDVWYHVGGANDPEGRSGFAHLFEHMLFQGSENVPRGGHFNLIAAAGGSSNATTSIDRTNYFETLPSHQLPLALWLEADRMASLVVDEANFAREREVVKEEYRLRVENQPYGKAFLALQTMPYDYEPYQRPVIGSIPDLDAATVDDVRGFHEIYYAPNNATLVVAGDFDVEQAQAMIDEYFGDIERGPDVPQLRTFEFTPQDSMQRKVFEDPLARVPALAFGYQIVPRNHPDYLPLELLSLIMGDGASSRMARALIDTGMARTATTYAYSNAGPGQFGVYLIPNAGVEVAELEQVYYDQLEQIRVEGVSDEELEKAINSIRMDNVLSLQSALGLAESIQQSNFYLGSPTAVFNELERYAEITSEDIQRVIETYLSPDSRNIVEIIPVESDESAPPPASAAAEEDAESTAMAEEDVEHESPPPPLPVREFGLPDITETELDNGLRVVIVPQDRLPLVAAQIILPGGTSVVPEDRAGMADFAASLLTRGTETRSAQDIAGAIEQIGGELDATAGGDALNVSTLVLKEHTDIAFELLSDVVLNPVFPEEELEVRRQRALTSLESALADPGSVAGRVFNALVYAGHPYSSLVSADTYNAITRDDLVDYYSARLNPAEASLIIAGDISVDEALERAEAAFGDWEATESALAAEPVEFPEMKHYDRTIYLVDRPGSTQVEIRLGHPGVIGSDPERRILSVMNRALGGGSSSRLFQHLREREGYTYSVFSSFNYPADRGVFLVSAAVRSEVLVPAIEAILEEIDRIQAEALPADELADTLSNVLGSYARGLETMLGLVGQIASFESRGVPLTELEEFPQAVAEVDAAAVLDSAQRYLHPDELVIVVVGDASVIRDGLDAIAPVQLIDENGVLLD